MVAGCGGSGTGERRGGCRRRSRLHSVYIAPRRALTQVLTDKAVRNAERWAGKEVKAETKGGDALRAADWGRSRVADRGFRKLSESGGACTGSEAPGTEAGEGGGQRSSWRATSRRGVRHVPSCFPHQVQPLHQHGHDPIQVNPLMPRACATQPSLLLWSRDRRFCSYTVQRHRLAPEFMVNEGMLVVPPAFECYLSYVHPPRIL